jgi:hypothetical protein
VIGWPLLSLLNADGTFNRSAIFSAAWRSARGSFLPFSHHLRRSWRCAKAERAEWQAKHAPAIAVENCAKFTKMIHLPPLTGLRAALFAAECIGSFRESAREQARIRALMN